MCVPCPGVESITVALIYARAGTELGGAALKLQRTFAKITLRA